MQTVSLTIDSKKRISLSKLIQKRNVRSVKAYWKNDKIILEPLTSIPEEEAWLYENENALKKVRTGLTQKSTLKRGSFSKYVKE